jgi:hypothetical protein
MKIEEILVSFLYVSVNQSFEWGYEIVYLINITCMFSGVN